MKLTGVEIHPDGSDDYTLLSFQDPTRGNPYNVKDIVGLDADSIIPRFYGPMTTRFYELSLEKREIVFKIDLNPKFTDNQTFSDLRDGLYKMISSSRTGKVQVQFKDGVYPVAGIMGFVTKFDTTQFEKEQEVQMTVRCDEPMLKALEPVIIPVNTLNFTRAVIRDDKSTAPHGFYFELNVTASITTVITITDPDDSSWNFTIAPGWGLIAGDRLVLSSDFKDRQLYVLRSGTKYQIGDWIAAGSVWPIIFPGLNTFSFTHAAQLAWNACSYYPTYWGV